MSDDRSEQQRFAGNFLELAEHRRLLQQISHDQRLIVASKTDAIITPKRSDLLQESDNGGDNGERGAVGFVLDCVARFSQDNPTSFIGRLHSHCCGSPDYHLESKASFFPEQFALNDPVSERIVVMRRIIISVIYRTADKPSAMRHSFDTEDPLEHVRRILPAAFESLLLSLLPGLDLDHSVTSFTLSLGEDDRGGLVLDSPCIVPIEDRLEAEVSDRVQWVQDVKHMDCAQLSELQVIPKFKTGPRTHYALVGSRTCTELKVPFATSRPQGDHEYREFFNDLKLLKSLQGCNGVPEFVGVVLDDTRLQLKAFLSESPVLDSFEMLFTTVTVGSKTISWLIREFWARQLIEAISGIHQRGSNVGVLRLALIGLRADGTPLLKRISCSTSPGRWMNKNGLMPPELRDAYDKDPRSLLKNTNFQTDIFQLDLILWQIAELRSKTGPHFCV